MSRYHDTVLTKQGRVLLAKLTKGECSMELTRAVTGDGAHEVDEDLTQLTALKNQVQSFGISLFRRTDDKLLIRFAVTNYNEDSQGTLANDYYIREVGIYAREAGSEEEVLYAVCTADVPAFMPAYETSPVTVTFNVYVYAGDGGTIVLKPDPTAFALADDLNGFMAENERVVNELKKSVSDGKSLIASAITSEGVTTAADAAFATLATNVNTVAANKYNAGKSAGVAETKKGNAVAANVLEGKTFTSNSAGVNQTGTMNNYSGKAVPTNTATVNIQDVTTGQWSNSTGMGSTLRFKPNFSGYVDTSSTIGMECYGLHPSVVKTGALIGGNGSPAAGALRGTYDKEASKPITADKVLSGHIGFVNGGKITGTMPNRGAAGKTLSAGGSYTIPAGYHNGSGVVRATDLSSQTRGTATADTIMSNLTAYVNGAKITGNVGEYRGDARTVVSVSGTVYLWKRDARSNISATAGRDIASGTYADYRIINMYTGAAITFSGSWAYKDRSIWVIFRHWSMDSNRNYKMDSGSEQYVYLPTGTTYTMTLSQGPAVDIYYPGGGSNQLTIHVPATGVSSPWSMHDFYVMAI